MGNCLIKQLQTTVEDSKLQKFDTLILNCDGNKNIQTLQFANAKPNSKVYLYNSDMSVIKGEGQQDFSFLSEMFELAQENDKILIENISTLTQINVGTLCNLVFEDFKYCPNLRTFTSAYAVGNIETLNYWKQLNIINTLVDSTYKWELYGDISKVDWNQWKANEGTPNQMKYIFLRTKGDKRITGYIDDAIISIQTYNPKLTYFSFYGDSFNNCEIRDFVNLFNNTDYNFTCKEIHLSTDDIITRTTIRTFDYYVNIYGDMTNYLPYLNWICLHRGNVTATVDASRLCSDLNYWEFENCQNQITWIGQNKPGYPITLRNANLGDTVLEFLRCMRNCTLPLTYENPAMRTIIIFGNIEITDEVRSIISYLKENLNVYQVSINGSDIN